MPEICVKATWVDEGTLCFNYEDCVKVEKILADFFKNVEASVQRESVVARLEERLLSSDEVLCQDSSIRLSRVFKGG